MYGAIIGDIAGSVYEFNNIKTKDFPLFSPGSDYTDDSIMTVAMGKAILLSCAERERCSDGGRSFRDILVEQLRAYGNAHPSPMGGYGARFSLWLDSGEARPYGSFGNGAAMRCSPCGLAAVTLREAQALARAGAAVTHDHPEGLKGAEAVASAVFLAKIGKRRQEIRDYITAHYYPLDRTLDEIRPGYRFASSCQETVPQALTAFFESISFEDAIRSAVSLGGDSDTLTAITGSVAWTYYAVLSLGYASWARNRFLGDMRRLRERAMALLPKDFVETETQFHELCCRRAAAYCRPGRLCTPILTEEEFRLFAHAPDDPAFTDKLSRSAVGVESY